MNEICCFLGAGFSAVAGAPLARDLFSPKYLVTMSEEQEARFSSVISDYESWAELNPDCYPEQFLSYVFLNQDQLKITPWKWAVECVCASVASPHTPPASLNRNPRYSNRINRPSGVYSHKLFWRRVFENSESFSVVTTNYDLLIERSLRHRVMKRPISPGFFYGGFSSPQIAKGAAQPFSRYSPQRFIEISGKAPLFKLHGSLNWSHEQNELKIYQDTRPVWRYGGTAAIVPPVEFKDVPGWLHNLWGGAELAFQRASTWIVCGYSLPKYDIHIRDLFQKSATSSLERILILDPNSGSLAAEWQLLAPEAEIVALQGLPECFEELVSHLQS